MALFVNTQSAETNGWDNCVALEQTENDDVIKNWKYEYVYRVADIKKHVNLHKAESILGNTVFHFFRQDKNHIINKESRVTILSRPLQTAKILRQGNETIKNDVLGVYDSLDEAVRIYGIDGSEFWMTWPEKVDSIEEKKAKPQLLAPAPTNHVVSPTPLLMPPVPPAEQTKAVEQSISQDKLISYNFIPAGKLVYAPTPHGLITAVKLKHGGFFLLVSKKNQTMEYDNAVQLIEDQQVNGEFVY